jgi:hypothetical protein
MIKRLQIYSQGRLLATWSNYYYLTTILLALKMDRNYLNKHMFGTSFWAYDEGTVLSH